MKTLKADDLDIMCVQNQKIWVVNTAKSILLINIPGSHCLRMPVSDEPLCLNNYYSSEIIKQATDLRRIASLRALQRSAKLQFHVPLPCLWNYPLPRCESSQTTSWR